ncbi:hypothetical protein ABPG77_000267 [Micractinium sp. CCAP 211/92]
MVASQRMPLRVLFLATFTALIATTEAHETLDAVRPSAVTFNWSEIAAPSWLPDAYIQNFSIDGLPLPAQPAAVPAAADCAALCRADPACSYFRYCERKDNCTDGTGGQLAYQNCQLLKADCLVDAHGVTAETISGFPVHHIPPGVLSAISVALARGISGADFECATSEVPGMCAFSDPLRAVLLCPELEMCQSMVALMGGLDGCSQKPVYVLKSDVLTEGNAFVSAEAFTLLLSEEGAKPESLFLLASEVTVQAPSYDELAAGGGPDAAAAAPYKGCIVAQGAIFLGTATGSISGVTTPEECCRECAKRLRAANVSERCNVWNHCAEEAGCDYDSPRDATRHSHMRQWQCELLYQEGAVAAGEAPPFVLAKGPELPFTAGAPLAACGPSIDDYQLSPGVSPFLYGSFPCQGSIRSKDGECVLMGSPQELADRCSADPQCEAFVLSMRAPLDASNGSASSHGSTVGVLKTGAPPASLYVVPAGVLYVQQPDSSGSGLSGGAIAGIAVGSAAAVAVLAVAAWLLIVRRRRGLRRRQAGAEGCPCCGGGSSASCGSEPKCSEAAKGPASAACTADLVRTASAGSASGTTITN